MLLLVCASLAQTGNDMLKELEESLKSNGDDFDSAWIEIEREFENYRREVNKEFAEYLSKLWKPVELQPGIPAPKKPDPVKPVVAPKENQDAPPKTPAEIPHGEIVPLVVPSKEKPLNIPLPKTAPECPRNNILLFNTPVMVSMGNNLKFKLNGVAEAEVSRHWLRLSGEEYTPIFEDCARICREMNLNGWGTWNLCRIVAEQLLGKGTNEAVVLQTYLMAELGYDAQMVRVGKNRLVTICPADVELCQISYISKNKKKYYIWDKVPDKCDIFGYDKNFASATRVMDFSDASTIKLDKRVLEPRTFTSKWDGQPSVKVSVKQSLMDYYRNMPLIKEWSFYAQQTMDEDLQKQVYDSLRKAISGKSETQAANILLHFVQTAFKYETDDEQFGREKTDFKEEPFYYRACDCEDRSILYSELVHSLLGLDVVLLHYPGHLATAVKFAGEVRGDYIMVEGKRYVVCDPTYINASIGNCMPKFKNVKANICKIR